MHPSFIETTSITSYWQFLQMVSKDPFERRRLFHGILFQINWSEPWLIALCGFHIICLLIIILTRGRLNIQILIFLALRMSIISMNKSIYCEIFQSHAFILRNISINSRLKNGSKSSSNLLHRIDHFYALAGYLLRINILIVMECSSPLFYPFL